MLNNPKKHLLLSFVSAVFFNFAIINFAAASGHSGSLFSQPDVEPYQWDTPWGVGIGIRRSDIPYTTKKAEVYDTLPLIYFKNKYVHINGLEAALHLWQSPKHQVNLYSRFRFVDIPKSLQNHTQAQAFDFGLQYRYTQGPWESDAAVLSDHYKRIYGYTRTQYHWQSARWQVTPFAELKWKTADFNQYYYGVERYHIGAGISFDAGVKARYYIRPNLYLLGQFGIDRLEDNVHKLPSIDSQYQYESFLGFGFFPDFSLHPKHHHGVKSAYSSVDNAHNQHYLRLAQGWATPSDLSEILTLQTKPDSARNTMTSIFYGTQLTNNLFNAPIDLYFTPGLVWHHGSSTQRNIAEGVMALKGYYTFQIGPKWRFGFAEGLSYSAGITNIEKVELNKKGYKPSKLLNYLDFSLDVNLGDIFARHQLNNLWFGYSIHHRSGIFESSSEFGRIGGGSNYQSLYLQWQY